MLACCLLTPGALLEAGTKEGRAQWVALLDLLAEAPLEGLVDGDVRVLMACFDVECYIDQLAGASASATTPNTPNTPNQIVTEQRSLLPTDEVASASDEIEALSLTMVHLLCSPPLQPLGQRLVEHLSRAAFPHNLGLALRAVLAYLPAACAALAAAETETDPRRPRRPKPIGNPCPKTAAIATLAPPGLKAAPCEAGRGKSALLWRDEPASP